MRKHVTLGAANTSGDHEEYQHEDETDIRAGRAGKLKETWSLVTALSHWLQPYLKPALPVAFQMCEPIKCNYCSNQLELGFLLQLKKSPIGPF